MDTSYSPVQYVYKEIIEEEIALCAKGQIFYFEGDQTVDSTTGSIVKMEEINGEGLFIFLDTELTLRVDRIITLFGKPGAAYDEYEAYANACLSCTGGYDL